MKRIIIHLLLTLSVIATGFSQSNVKLYEGVIFAPAPIIVSPGSSVLNIWGQYAVYNYGGSSVFIEQFTLAILKGGVHQFDLASTYNITVPGGSYYNYPRAYGYVTTTGPFTAVAKYKISGTWYDIPIGQGGAVNPYSFEVIPPAPALIWPPNGQTILNDLTPDLTWNTVQNANYFWVQVDNNSNFSSPEAENTMVWTGAWSPSMSSYDTYYWKVKAHTSTNVWSEWSTTRSFTLQAQQQQYTITANAGSGGTINPSGNVIVNSGANQTFTITPNNCYHIVNVVVDGVGQGVRTSYTFTNVTAAHSISASFALDVYSIAANASTGGIINPSGDVAVNCGASQLFTITANSGYQISNVLIDGTSQGAISSYIFSNVTDVHSIFASFSQVSSPSIAVSISVLPDFLNVQVGTNSTSQPYTVSGSNMVADIVIDAPSGFQVSTNNSTFSSSVILPQSGGTVSNTTIWARFSPTTTGVQSGSIGHTSTSATTKNVSVSGTGISAPTPIITVSTTSLPDFLNVQVGTNSTSQPYTVSGSNMAADIVIDAPSGFQVSTNNSTFSSSVILPQSGGTVSNTTIWARFSPTTTGVQSGSIGHTSTSATTKNVSVSGTGTSPGTIVIVHGFTFITGQIPEWEYVMADSIAKRMTNATVYKIEGGNITEWKKRGNGQDKIIVFNWAQESNRWQRGFSEAAADVLASMLIQGQRENKWSLELLHFIGHSRGAIVCSEAIERLGLYSAKSGMLPGGLKIDQKIHFTTLDPHPWDRDSKDHVGEPLTAEDYKVNSFKSAVVCWDNVGYADNYYHHISAPLGNSCAGILAWIPPLNLVDLSGLSGMSGFYDTDLTSLLNMTHCAVHAWYFGTIPTNFQADDGDGMTIYPSWYNNNETLRKSLGFNLSYAAGGDPSPFAVTNRRPISDDKTLVKDKEFNGWLFNGGFEMYNTNLITSDWEPGWQLHGGGGNGNLKQDNQPSINSHLELDWSSESKTHNRFYIPFDATKIWFRLKVHDKAILFSDHLKVFIDTDERLDHVLSKTHEYLWTSIDIPTYYRGTTQTLTFELYSPLFGIASEIWIDDVGFTKNHYILSSVSTHPIAAISNQSKEREGDKSPNSILGAMSIKLHAYDADGNHTGPTSDSSWEENIPGSQYILKSDSLSQLYAGISLPEAPPEKPYIYKILSNNTAGTFGMKIEDVTGEDYTVSATFDTIVYGPATTAQCSLQNVSSQILLQIDNDGDGNFETQLPPSKLEEINVGVSVSKKWNLISLPVKPIDSRYITLFPSGISNPYAYGSSGYYTGDTLITGLGYWMKYDSAMTVELGGLTLSSDTVQVDSGWNIIGSLSEAFPTNVIGSIPLNIVTSEFYDYTGSYVTTDTIFPGRGYWVKVNENGILLLSLNSMVEPSNRINIIQTFEIPPLPPLGGDISENVISYPFTLFQNYPNPFNPTTLIKYTLSYKSRVVVDVYDLLGRRVELLIDGDQEAGEHEIAWFVGKDVGSGIYLYRLQTDTFTETKKLLLLR